MLPRHEHSGSFEIQFIRICIARRFTIRYLDMPPETGVYAKVQDCTPVVQGLDETVMKMTHEDLSMFLNVKWHWHSLATGEEGRCQGSTN